MAEVIENPDTSSETQSSETQTVHRGGCCSGQAPKYWRFTTKGADGKSHSLHAEGDRLTIGKDDRATPFTLAIHGPETISLKLPGTQGVRASGGILMLADNEAGNLVAEGADGGGLRLHTTEGLYLVARNPGEPVELTPDAVRATAFMLKPSVAKYAPLWAADEGFPHDEKHSTHLWIFRRAAEWILSKESLGNGPQMTATYHEHDRRAVRSWLADKTFTDQVEQGIYDADNTGKADVDTSGFIFSAHFWHLEADIGGWWDPNPKINAYEYGARYFRESLDESDLAQSGRKLGLAIHFLTDLTQPMHCGLYPNAIDEWSGAGLYAALLAGQLGVFHLQKPPEPLPNLFAGNKASIRHELYEQWVLARQDQWRIAGQELNQFDIRVERGKMRDQMHPAQEYWRKAATEGLAVYRSWINDPKSPIGSEIPGDGPIPDFVYPLWERDIRKMLHLAQRLVINLLLTWGANARIAVPFRQPPVEGPDVLLVTANGRVLHVSLPDPQGVKHDEVWLTKPTKPGSNANDFWVNDPVRDAAGHPVVDKGRPVYRLRNRETGKCIVAGDRYDGNLYYQYPLDESGNDRTNSHWVFTPAGDRTGADGIVHRCYTIQDLKWGKYIGETAATGGIGRASHGDTPVVFMLVPRRN